MKSFFMFSYNACLLFYSFSLNPEKVQFGENLILKDFLKECPGNRIPEPCDTSRKNRWFMCAGDGLGKLYSESIFHLLSRKTPENRNRKQIISWKTKMVYECRPWDEGAIMLRCLLHL